MSTSFWNIDEIQQIFDETTQSIITKNEIERIGEVFKSKGYKLLNMSDSDVYKEARLVPESVPIPALTLEIGDKLYPLVDKAIAILRESLENYQTEKQKIEIALKVLEIVFTSGIVDL